FSPFILVSNLIIKETNAFLLYKKLALLLIFLVTTLNIIDPKNLGQQELNDIKRRTMFSQ
ncbi:hypothetical protein, partial [Tetragenococcus halophilus]|uniref:hypothetical protein n=1 Tax=Tetragenococcus halophilus TaxID=51669 RepID=UPI00295E65B0